MFVVFLYVVNNSTCDLNTSQQEEISQDEKYFAVLVKMCAHVVLEHE